MEGGLKGQLPPPPLVRSHYAGPWWRLLAVCNNTQWNVNMIGLYVSMSVHNQLPDDDL